MTSTPGDWSVTSVLCAPTPGPCNATHDVGHHPTWQGQLTCTSPTWGSRLCKSGMPACAVRVLKSTSGFGVIEGDPGNAALQFAVSMLYDSCSIFVPSFRAIGVGGVGTWLLE